MYIADLHIHSRYSRATSRDLTPEQLDFQAFGKGIRLLGTGDFTHPAWREELKEKLIPAEDGLYCLREEYRLNSGRISEEERTRFVVSGEISSIYKQDGKVRKVHSLILLPGLEEAEKLAGKLETIGNIHSDGRPILGLSCHDLLEIMLEVCPEGMFIPAHIWTPHFSMFGAFSGFDRVEECFGELAPYIHAVETGLSSDPPMNWRLSVLDRYQLLSNSDAHSPAKLGREANLLTGELSYEGLKKAVETGEGLAGTIEFFPEEGKYHYDGHRKCHIAMSPGEAEACGGVCPVCKKKLTMGVSHRISQLADRPEGFVPERAKPFESLVPLLEVIGASTGRSAAGKRVQELYRNMIESLGNEFSILREVPLEDIRHGFGTRVAEGIRRLRTGQVKRLPGFDGEYGIIRLFDAGELENTDGQLSMKGLLELENREKRKNRTAGAAKKLKETGEAVALEESGETGEAVALKESGEAGGTVALEENGEGGKPAASEKGGQAEDFLDRLNENQRQAAEMPARSLAVIAGPGTGKTGTLTARIRCLLERRRVKPSEITAVTFTNRAAAELRERLGREMPHRRLSGLLRAGTFHALCLELLTQAGVPVLLAENQVLLDLADKTIKEKQLDIRPSEFLSLVSEEKLREALSDDDSPAEESRESIQESLGQESRKNRLENREFQDAAEVYRERLRNCGLSDFDDLLVETLRLLREENEAARRFCAHFRYLLVDEFQDINPIQYQLIREWNRDGRELFVIGDPDQAIYGFRGADSQCFQHLLDEMPKTGVVRLEENYRCTGPITRAACCLISHNTGGKRTLHAAKENGLPVRVVRAAGKRAEGIFAAREINRLIGGIDMLDAQGRDLSEPRNLRSFSEIAILCRTNRQAEEMEEYLQTEGIPYVVTGRGSFLEAASVREATAFFKGIFLEGEKEEEARKYFEQAGIYEALREKYRPLQKEKPAKLLKKWAKERGLEKDEALLKLSSMAIFHKTMKEFLETLAHGGDEELRRSGTGRYMADAVTLMTLHASKGLEFPVVLIPGVRKNSIPLEYDEEVSEEERRLLFVGMTRAREELVLITSGTPSCFLEELPGEIVQEQARGGWDSPHKMRQLTLFDFM